MERKPVDIVNEWGIDVVAEMVSIIESSGASNTGSLADSLTIKAREDGERIIAELKMEDYGQFVLEGVKGAQSSSKAPRSPFSFKSKMPPARPIDNWVVKKGLTGTRDDSGRFVSRRSLVFAIRKSIYKFGISPLNFVSPFYKMLPDLQNKLGQAYKTKLELDIKEMIEK